MEIYTQTENTSLAGVIQPPPALEADVEGPSTEIRGESAVADAVDETLGNQHVGEDAFDGRHGNAAAEAPVEIGPADENDNGDELAAVAEQPVAHDGADGAVEDAAAESAAQRADADGGPPERPDVDTARAAVDQPDPAAGPAPNEAASPADASPAGDGAAATEVGESPREAAAVQPADKPDFGMPVHPVCDLFPRMSGPELTKLADDIRANGLVHPVVIHDNQMVDGRNRFLACRMAGVEPRYVEWRAAYRGPMTLSRWISSVNLARRHLSTDQVTMAHVAVRLWEETEAAKQRQVEAGKQQADHGRHGGRGNKKPLQVKSPEGVSSIKNVSAAAPRSRKDRSGEVCRNLAGEIGTTEYRVRQAAKVQQTDPELAKRVIAGDETLRDAAKRVDPKHGKRAADRPPKRTPTSRNDWPPECRNVAPDIEEAVRSAMCDRPIDQVYESLPEARRDEFIRELIRTLDRMT